MLFGYPTLRFRCCARSWHFALLCWQHRSLPPKLPVASSSSAGLPQLTACLSYPQMADDARAVAAAAAAAAPPVADAALGALLAGDGPYFRGTRMPVHGWFQFCRGCNTKTARLFECAGREVSMCGSCAADWRSMQQGDRRAGAAAGDDEPLASWLPHLVPPGTPRLSNNERQHICEKLLIRQDNAWLALVQTQL